MDTFLRYGEYMLTKEDLLSQSVLPNISDISLLIYTEFSEQFLMNRKLHYFFTDETDMVVEFREWGIYHMLSIQHINSRIKNHAFFEAVHNGLELSSFEEDRAIKQRYKKHKQRITAFSCLYYSLIHGDAFFIPSGHVKNTAKVEADYLIFHMSNTKGLNYGLRKVGDVYVPITILISKSSDPDEYLEDSIQKIIKKLEILDVNDNILGTIDKCKTNE